MKVSLERQGTNIVQMGLELEAAQAIRAYEVACRQLSNRVNIPGFRKGKAPKAVVEKAVGIELIKREALDKLVPELLGKAIVQEKLDVITEPHIDSCKFELGEPLTLTAKFEVRPEVKLGKYQGLNVNVPEAQLPADAIDRALNNIAESKATLADVEKRPIAMGDTVVMDFECYVNSKLVDGGKAEGLILEMKEGNFLEGFCEQLIGKEPDNQVEVKIRFPENYRNTELAGKNGLFQVNIRGIRQKTIPEINDELAKSAGLESLAKLKEYLLEKLNEEVRQENDTRSQKAIVDAVVSSAQVDVPESMIERETNLLVGQMKQIVEQNGQSWDAFQEAPEFAKIKETKKLEAHQRVLTSLVLGAIVRQEQLSVNEDEMVPYLVDLSGRYNVPIEKIAQNEEVRRQIMEEILTQKVVEFLQGKSEIRFIPDEAPKQEASAVSKS